MKPIHYDQRQFALMVEVALHFHEKKSPLLSFKSLGVEPDGKGGYVWNPR
jgi:hypothetical protein